MPRRAAKAAAFLPLKPVWFHILVTLADEAAHGYAVRQAVEARTDGRIRLWPATLYGALSELLRAGLIDEIESPETEPEVPRRTYQLTALGRDVLSAETRRLEELLHIARNALGRSRP
jgi:DNA-binding PadR family transcriptional regulator